MAAAALIRLAASDELVDGGPGLRFAVELAGRAATGFAIRRHGQARAYLNQCAHVAMELDWQPGVFFDGAGEFLMCATHGALYEPATGRCAGGPCAGRGSLRPLTLVERGGALYWQPDEVVRAPPNAAAAAG
ncbi:MAG: Rieske 2Fe-2S domain-containing protein [Burkholderiales bacterium]|jgi:nitrite reductase/ring-hydroxylating ferredoxin subunit|nr:Rieske 2Fe-2S domain-containing protein [Burkholderiales bacterium]MCA3214641.1 Rieske 2Fe-2S domain-containing protein [Burkholderiales bacterium]MCA3224188.1 Rieske 2Fe-2S domain-containing protein [Burkholderiales bacterium]MCE2643687.1 Rieske 2Fe-2S domain-containing protein [Burkholderiaceae bacterium]